MVNANSTELQIKKFLKLKPPHNIRIVADNMTD